jgi:LmbE family N-acetylglucosaminyl deacetylase
MASVPWRLLLVALGATLVLSVSGAPALPLATPAAPALNRGESIAQELRNFANTGSVLHIGAHPDDENTELITWLSRGRGYRTAYLSLTRGDGGQNELGPEFDEKLGVLRTQELLAARRLDGGRQFFTRAIDFGYSKTPEETLRFWDRGQVLADVVRIYRQFRPDVVVTRFPVPPGSGGHGHHTASGILAVEAFQLAGDPGAYPEQLAEGLTPWQPRRVLWNSWPGRDGGLSGPSFTLDISGTDPVTGESFGLIAAHSRAMHKTQGLAGFINRARTGTNEQNFMLLAGEPAATDLLDGIDPAWTRYPGGAEIAALATAALAQFNPEAPAASLPALLTLHRKLTALPSGGLGRATVDPLVADKRAQLDRIIQSCLGLEVESTVDRAEVVPGEKIRVTTTTRIAQAAGKLIAHVNPSGGLTALQPGQPDTHTVEAATPASLPLTQPYWLREESLAGISRVSDPRLIGLPESPPTLSLRHEFAIDDVRIFIDDEPVHLTHGEKGEQRHRLNVIAPVSLALGSEVYLVAPGTAKTITVGVTAARVDTAGALQLEAPAGWTVVPAAQDFRLTDVGDQARLAFVVTAPTQPTPGHLTAVAEVAGRRYSNQRIELRYDHLPVQLLQPPARARLASFDLGLRGRSVGYLPGAGDAVAGCLEQMGCTVRMLSGADLTPEKLAGLDAVVIGVRAFNERSDLKENFPGLLAWVEAGGTVVAQYNRPNRLLAPELGPYALSIQGPTPALRVTDETAPVTLLAPDHLALNTPNQITATDFEGWVQERGAYFPSSWDQEHYTALLAMNDPGEAPLHGSVLIARHGRGHYVYTGLAFFRQLPAGVPGAYRLFANLLSLGP